MMYCTIAQFVDIFSEQEAMELTNLEDPGAVVLSESRLEAALTNASQVIDGYIQNRVTLPLASVPGILVQRCADIARYLLDRNRTRDEVRLRYEDAIAWLKDVSKGVVNLGLDSQVPPQSPTLVPDRVYVTASNRVFTDEFFSGY